MKCAYKGHELWVERDRAMGGWDSVYFTIVRQHDGFMVEDSFTSGEERIPAVVRALKRRVDAELAEAAGKAGP